MSIETLERGAIFDIFKTLQVIENNPDLDEIFRGEQTDISYKLLKTLAKNNTLPDDIHEKLHEIFERIITKNKVPLTQYLKLPDIDLSTRKVKVSKHYGKRRVLEDIKNNNGKTELDDALLALNDIRNIYAKLKRKAIKDKNGGNNLTSSDCRDIVAVTRILKNKVSKILKKQNEK